MEYDKNRTAGGGGSMRGEDANVEKQLKKETDKQPNSNKDLESTRKVAASAIDACIL